MEKINSFSEVIIHLKEKEILTTKNKDFFVYKKEKVFRYFNGSCFAISIEDFIELYKKETFFIYEESGTFIDNDKDEAYYRYYKK